MGVGIVARSICHSFWGLELRVGLGFRSLGLGSCVGSGALAFAVSELGLGLGYSG